jgi:hypothetical protein
MSVTSEKFTNEFTNGINIGCNFIGINDTLSYFMALF